MISLGEFFFTLLAMMNLATSLTAPNTTTHVTVTTTPTVAAAAGKWELPQSTDDFARCKVYVCVCVLPWFQLGCRYHGNPAYKLTYTHTPSLTMCVIIRCMERRLLQ